MTRYAPQWLQVPTYPAALDRRLIGALWPAAASSGLAVTVSAGMVLNIAPGQVAIPTPNSTGTTLCTSDAVEQVTIGAAPAAGLNRIDMVCARARGNDLDGGVNDDFTFHVVAGAVFANPSPPAVPSGSVALAQVNIDGGVAAIVAGKISDKRPGGLSLANAPVDPSLPKGEVGYTERQTNSGTTDDTVIDVALNVTVTMEAGRRYRIVVRTLIQGAGTTAATYVELYIRQGSLILQTSRVPAASGQFISVDTELILNGVAGAQTYKASIARNSGGAGTINVVANASRIAFIQVEDIGEAI